MWERFKIRTTRAYLRFKKWIISVLIAIGLITPAILYAETVTFTYTPATQRSDGTALPLSDIKETRIYCDSVMIISEPGADGDIDVDLGLGTHTCHATHVDINDIESLPSNTVVRVVIPAPPGSPNNLSSN